MNVMHVYTLSPTDISELRGILTSATLHGTRVRVATDGGLKVDAGAGWSLPMGTDTTGRS